MLSPCFGYISTRRAACHRDEKPARAIADRLSRFTFSATSRNPAVAARLITRCLSVNTDKFPLTSKVNPVIRFRCHDLFLSEKVSCRIYLDKPKLLPQANRHDRAVSIFVQFPIHDKCDAASKYRYNLSNQIRSAIIRQYLYRFRLARTSGRRCVACQQRAEYITRPA